MPVWGVKIEDVLSHRVKRLGIDHDRA